MATNKQRTAIASLVLSAAGLVGIATSESYTSTAVIPVPGDKWTIGFGTTEGVKMGDKITPQVALARALDDVQKYEGAIKACVHVPLYQYEYDSYTSLAYNIGTGAFCRSTLVAKLNTGDYPGACSQILVWDKFRGAPLRGLTIRRQREYKTCIGEV
jgi:lysozyme